MDQSLDYIGVVADDFLDLSAHADVVLDEAYELVALPAPLLPVCLVSLEENQPDVLAGSGDKHQDEGPVGAVKKYKLCHKRPH